VDWGFAREIERNNFVFLYLALALPRKMCIFAAMKYWSMTATGSFTPHKVG
jgi:hypothetical protein